ncbi:hypothetical protein SAY87_008765 [Trapa incisa]|uniref:Uncharacterized protein n=1 Tax=Trapa incisa TaxID=236973 RepID=A0AAN7JUU8_9MYRT|nr:hypothetical protein SAY87_008765 [Trapa incisa]
MLVHNLITQRSYLCGIYSYVRLAFVDKIHHLSLWDTSAESIAVYIYDEILPDEKCYRWIGFRRDDEMQYGIASFGFVLKILQSYFLFVQGKSAITGDGL